MLEEVEGCPAKTAISAGSAISSKICKKLEKSQCLLKLLNSSGEGGIRRVPSKHNNFCNFCDFSKNCEKLEKSQFLLKLLNSSGKGHREVPNKNCDLISSISPKIGKSLSCDVLSMISMYEVNLMVFLYRFILHGIRAIAEIVGMFSADLYVLRRK